MNKNALYPYGVGIFIVCWTIACSLLCQSTYYRQEELILTRISSILKESIKIEQKKRILYSRRNYNTSLSPNSISVKEKEEWCNQHLFLKKDPYRSRLDSIFHAELKRKRIKAIGIICCTYKKQSTYSSSDTLLREEATPLSPIIYRFDENPDHNITLQAYVKPPQGWLLIKHSPLTWGLLFILWVIGIIGFFWGYYYWKKLKAQIPLTDIETNIAIQWVELPGGLRFDKQHGIVVYKGKEIQLTPNSASILNCLLEAENYTLTHGQIYAFAYDRKYREDLSREEKTTLNKAIKRLRGQLADIPFIQIKAYKGKGYQLAIEPLPPVFTFTGLYKRYKQSFVYKKSYPVYYHLSQHFKKDTKKINKKRGRPKKPLYEKVSLAR
jgi:hypothetical protein